MKTLALTTLVAALTLVGCGGGGGSDNTSVSGNQPSNPSTPVEPAKFTLSSNVMSEGSKLPLEHFCKPLGGQALVPNLMWSNYPKDTAGFVIFSIIPRPVPIEPIGIMNYPYNNIVALSTNILPVTTNFISTGEDITKTIPGAVWGRNAAMDYGWWSPCQSNSAQGDTIIFKIFAVSEDFKSVPIQTNSYVLWNPGYMVYNYSKYILGEASLTVKLK